MWNIGRVSSETFWDKEDCFILSHILVSLSYYFDKKSYLLDVISTVIIDYYWLFS